MILDIYQVDAFTSKIFKGNPAAVVPLFSWLPDEILLNIAAENNLSETAFFVPNEDGSFNLRWFTPTMEVSLCGHATLATSWVICNQLGYDKKELVFKSKQSGTLTVQRSGNNFTLDLPALDSELSNPNNPFVIEALGEAPLKLYQGKKWTAVVSSADSVINFNPDFYTINKIPAQGLIITARSDKAEYDIISRYFGPQLGVDEDPVTGAAHCLLTPIWTKKLEKNHIKAYQASPRGAFIECELNNDRVLLTGQAALYLKGKIYV